LNLAYRAWNEVSVSNMESVAVLIVADSDIGNGDEAGAIWE